jgi:hypothetical protein
MKVKACWLKSDGKMLVSVERTGKLSNLARLAPARNEEEDEKRMVQPRLTVFVPEEPVGVSEWLSGTISEGSLTSITIDCGNGPVSLPYSNVQINGNNFHYHFTGFAQPGQTCLVCVTAENPVSSITVCYYITFR